MENLVEETKQVMRQYGVVADKRFGQNFLVCDYTVSQIIEKSEISNNDLVIEIGPGLGTLTKHLLEKAGKVICIELDKRMISVLEGRFANCDNLEIVFGDILKIDLKQLIENNSQFEKVKIVANLPYYITSPIIMKLLEERLNIDTITIMIQKEVADRIVADPGNKDFGVLTLSTSYYAKARSLLQVTRDKFIPAPNVDSTVILLEVYKDKVYDVKDEKLLFSVIKGGFSQRRKMFINSIETVLRGYQIDKQDFKDILCKYNINEMVRAEELGLNEFINIANEIYYIINKR